MPLEQLERLQVIPSTLQEAWSFFSRPDNLSAITPPWLNFEVTSSLPAQMYPGMILTYTVSPVAGLPLEWVTEITHCSQPRLFIDEQRIGPYRFWHHQHHFREVPAGVEVRDLVHYKLPLGPLGRIASRYVRKRLEAIFDFRREAVQQLLGTEGKP
jgi:ligand-binding SRPBCC domain-containing protein